MRLGIVHETSKKHQDDSQPLTEVTVFESFDMAGCFLFQVLHPEKHACYWQTKKRVAVVNAQFDMQSNVVSSDSPAPHAYSGVVATRSGLLQKVVESPVRASEAARKL